MYRICTTYALKSMKHMIENISHLNINEEKSAFVNAVSIVTFATVQCNLPLIVTAVIYQFAGQIDKFWQSYS